MSLNIGDPVTPEEVSKAEFIGFNRSGEFIAAMTRFGLTLTQKNFPLISENHLVQWSHVKQGLGIGVMAADIGDAEPGVVQVLPDLEPMVFPVWLVTHREVHTSRRVRLVFDLMAEALARPYEG